MNNYNKSVLLLLSMASVPGLMLNAAGASWRLEPSLALTETYTDNVDLDASSRQSDFVTQVTPGILITGKGARLETSLSYAPNYFYYPGDNNDKHDFRHNLEASLESELISETLFIEGSANIDQRFLDRRLAISSERVGRTNNRQTVQTYHFSPYLVHAFGTWATAQLKYDINHIRIGSSTRTTSPDTKFGNSLRHQGSFSITNGSRFRRLGWTLLGQYQTERRAVGPDFKDTVGRADFSYQLTHILAILGSAGYEKRDSPGSFANFGGFIWDAGFRLVPGPRTSLSFRYGNQFDGDTFSLEAQYKITSKDSIDLSYRDTIQTFQSLAFNSSDNVVNLDSSQNSSFISGDLTRRKRATLSLSGTRGRTTYSAAAFYSKDVSDNVGLNEKRYGGAVSLERQLSRRLSIGGSFSYNLSRFLSDNIDDKFWSASATVDYRISKSLVGSFEYVHSDRAQARLASLNGGSNFITLSIRAAI